MVEMEAWTVFGGLLTELTVRQSHRFRIVRHLTPTRLDLLLEQPMMTARAESVGSPGKQRGVLGLVARGTVLYSALEKLVERFGLEEAGDVVDVLDGRDQVTIGLFQGFGCPLVLVGECVPIGSEGITLDVADEVRFHLVRPMKS
jgi:hypothetical protein